MSISKREKIVLISALIAIVGGGIYYLKPLSELTANKIDTSNLKELPNGNLQKTVKIPPPVSKVANKTFREVASDYISSSPDKKVATEYISLTYDFKNASLNAETAYLKAKASESRYNEKEWNVRFNDLESEGAKSLERTAITTESGGFKSKNTTQNIPLNTINQNLIVSSDPHAINFRKFALDGIIKVLDNDRYVYKAYIKYGDDDYTVRSGYELFGKILIEVTSKKVILTKMDEEKSRPYTLYVDR